MSPGRIWGQLCHPSPHPHPQWGQQGDSGFWHWLFHDIPLRGLPEHTWRGGHGREQGPQCHRDREKWHVLGPRTPMSQEHGSPAQAGRALGPQGNGNGDKSLPCPGREGTGDPNSMGVGTRDPAHAGRGLGTPTAWEWGQGTLHMQGRD